MSEGENKDEGPKVIYMDMDLGPLRNHQYIGDGVTVSHDDLQLWVTTDDQRIALDKDVFGRLIEYAKRFNSCKELIK
jgi:hypothetical protein